ncbi:MAG: four-carbon acid sugar kinase family protein [Bryobacterales bacterium]|nr:four-carbon acid sugar kinase family protein [Bryobacterales bacterium]
MKPLLVIADDATGALEAGAILANCGFDTEVQFAAVPELGAQARVVLVPTRHDTADVARQRVAKALAACGLSGNDADRRRLFWKTDSTLRGPIGGCFDALLRAFPGVAMVYIPAYPALGRTVRGGELLVDGIPLAQTPYSRNASSWANDSSVIRRISDSVRCDVELVRTASELRMRLNFIDANALQAVLVCDAESEPDVEALVRECRDSGSFPLVAGPAGTIAAWAGRSGAPRLPRHTLTEVSDWIVVCGSRHPNSRALADEAAMRGWRVFTMPESEQENPSIQLAALAGRAAGAAREGIVVFGGDTLLAVSRVLNIDRFLALGEILPGVAVSRARDFMFMTKAGGFAASQLFDVLQSRKAK